MTHVEPASWRGICPLHGPPARTRWDCNCRKRVSQSCLRGQRRACPSYVDFYRPHSRARQICGLSLLAKFARKIQKKTGWNPQDDSEFLLTPSGCQNGASRSRFRDHFWSWVLPSLRTCLQVVVCASRLLSNHQIHVMCELRGACSGWPNSSVEGEHVTQPQKNLTTI